MQVSAEPSLRVQVCNLTNKLKAKPGIPGVGRNKTRPLLVCGVRTGYVSQPSDLTAVPK